MSAKKGRRWAFVKFLALPLSAKYHWAQTMFSRKSSSPGKVPPGWFHHSNAVTTIVFVHGVMSDHDSAWRGTAFWPELVRTDNRLPSLNIYLATYHTGFATGRYGVADCANELLEALSVPMCAHSPVMESDEIIFVCHSMGGLVVRTMLTENTHIFSCKKIGLVLMASPSMGSRYANWVAPFASAIGHAQALGLRWDGEELKRLDERFRQLLHQKRIPRLVGAEAQEHVGPVMTWLGKLFSARIVPSESGSRYFGAPRLLADTSHITIVKPSGYESPGHRFLLRYLLEDYGLALAPEQIRKEAQPTVEVQTSEISKILFDSLDRTSLAYYLRRTDDDRLSSSMAQFSVWLVGPSGVGKTSAARAQILALGYPVVELCLSAYAGKMSVVSCLDELAYVLEHRTGATIASIDRTEQAIFREVAKLADNGSLILYFDEVPLNGETSEIVDEFTAFIIRLLNFVKDQSHCPGFRILLSSVDSPGAKMTLDGKVRERLKVVDLELWSDASLKELLALVLPSLQNSNPDFIPDEVRIIGESSGLPRELKNILRESIARRGWTARSTSSSAGIN